MCDVSGGVFGDHDEADGLHSVPGSADRSLGQPSLRPAGPGPAQAWPRAPVAPARLPAGLVWLLFPGHRGLPPGHLQRLPRRCH